MDQEIGLGDIVQFNWNDGYSIGTVCSVHTDGTIDVFRPYVHTADFSCAGQGEGSTAVICYIGTETVKRIDPKRMKLVAKGSPLK